MQQLEQLPNMKVIRPLGYLDFLKLMSDSSVVITDSGGIQEETTVLNVPCLTVRENTERPVTVTNGTNTLVGADAARIFQGFRAALDGIRTCSRPELWDGKAAERIVNVLLKTLKK